MSTALTNIETLKAVEVFSKEGGLDPILQEIEKEARSLVLDASTNKGREEIRSIAHKITRSRTTLFKMAKDLTEEWRDSTKKVNAERARMEEFLKKLEEEIRAPLTEFEDKEKNRVVDHEAAIAFIEGQKVFETDPTVEELQSRIDYINNDTRDWEEFSNRAGRAKQDSLDFLTKKRDALVKYQEEQAELARLRKAEEERLQKEREETIAKEAAEKARLEAERVAKEAAEKEAARVKAAQEAADKKAREEKEAAEKKAAEEKVAREKAEQDKKDAEERAAKAEADRIAAAEKAAADAKAAEERAEREKKEAEEAATKREQERQAAEKKAEEDAAAKREADLAHRKKINNEAKEDMEKAVADTDGTDPAKAIIIAIANGQIRHVRITY